MTPAIYLAIGFLCGTAILSLVWYLRARVSASLTLAKVRGVEEELRSQIEQLSGELTSLRVELAGATRQSAELSVKASHLEEALHRERQQIETLQQTFHKEFEAVSNKLLLSTSTHFNEQSSKRLETVLSPLKEELKDFKSKLEASHVSNVKHSALLQDEISRIGTEAANLSRALKGDVKILGNWGENMLDQILDKSGLQEGVHYRRQQSGRAEEGGQRFIDVVINLPGDKHLVIDSKVSLKCYEQHFNSGDETSRLTHLDDHLSCIRTHVRGLGAKRYQELLGINAPDFVLMYIPIEAAFFVAVAHDPDLFSEALERNVVITTNSTLLATLRTVASVWRLADQQKNAVEIAKRGGQLYDKFVGFIGDLQTVGSFIKKSHEVWELATGKLHTGPGNLVRQVEQLRELGVKAAKALPPELKAKSEEGAVMPQPFAAIAETSAVAADERP